MPNIDLPAKPSWSRSPRVHSQMFTVRLWLEEADAGPEYRGHVRNVVSGAYRGFREWSELTDFMVARVQEGVANQRERTEREP
jgi:hypothetical protein